jgi:putative sterol carrier protein
MTDFNELMKSLPKMVDAEEAKGLNGRVQFSLSGEGGGEWGVVLDDGKVTVSEGAMTQPQLTIKTSTENADKLLSGKLDPMMAFMTGKIKISGDMALGMKLIGLLKR